MKQCRGSVDVLEVLLCVCVCGVLIAIILPVINHPRIATKSPCQSNLKECIVALQLYCNDYNGCLPSSALVNHSEKWNRRDFATFATRIGNFPIKSGQHLRTWPELLASNMKKLDYVYCDDDPVYGSKLNRNSRVSYWYKAAVDRAWYGDGCAKPCRKMSDFIYDADQIVFYECRSFHFPKKTGFFGKQNLPLRNGVQINAAFLDTHVKTITLKNATSGNHNNCAANSDGEPMYFNYDYKTSKKLPEGEPAKYIDPGRYGDNL